MTDETKGDGMTLEQARALFESALEKSIAGNPVDAPFPMDQEQARVWHQARVSAFQWVLEMFPGDAHLAAQSAMRVDVPTWESEQERVDPEHMFAQDKFMQDEIDSLRAALQAAIGKPKP